MDLIINFIKFFVILIFINIITADEAKPIKCYVCPDECTITDKTEQRNCGASIGPTQAAYCVKEWKIGTNHTDKALRRCVIAKKGEKPICDDGYECGEFCQTDLCNTATIKLPMNRYFIVSTTILLVLFKPLINLF